MGRICLALLALSFAAGVAAQDDRAAIEARFKAANEICAQRFFVNACLDEAKARRNADLKPLQEREALMDANARRARADAQRERVAEREREFAAVEGRHRTAELLATPKPAAPAAPGDKPKAASAPNALSLDASRQAKQTQAHEAAQRRQVQKADYQSEQLARQKAAEQRQTVRDEKLAGKKPPAALPLPSAAEIEAASSAPPPQKR
jgi:colicin import membrane protein